jgi:hypothetical protein
MSAIHGKKAGKKTAKGKARKVKKRVGRPKGFSTKIAMRSKKGAMRASLLFGDGSVRVIGEMQAYHSELLAQRTSLDAQIDAFARAMETVGATTPRRMVRRKPAKRRTATARGVRPGSLKDYIGRVLSQSSKPMRPGEIGVSVKKAGFKTKAKNITKAISNTIPAMTNVKKVGFGLYQHFGRAK